MAHLFRCLSAFPRYAFSLQLFMVRFCSESLLVVPVFFSVVRLNLFLWKNLLQRPLGAAGLSALMSVVFGSDSAVLFIFLLRISVMTFYLWHSLCKRFHTAHHQVFSCPPAQLEQILSGLLLSKPGHELLYHFLFHTHSHLSPQIPQPVAAAASTLAVPRQLGRSMFAMLPTANQDQILLQAQSLRTGRFWRSRRLWYHDRGGLLHSLNCQVKYSDGTRPITSSVPKYRVTRHSLRLSILTCDALCLPQFLPNSEQQNCRFSLTQTAGDRGAGSRAVAPGL